MCRGGLWRSPHISALKKSIVVWRNSTVTQVKILVLFLIIGNTVHIFSGYEALTSTFSLFLVHKDKKIAFQNLKIKWLGFCTSHWTLQEAAVVEGSKAPELFFLSADVVCVCTDWPGDSWAEPMIPPPHLGPREYPLVSGGPLLPGIPHILEKAGRARAAPSTHAAVGGSGGSPQPTLLPLMARSWAEPTLLPCLWPKSHLHSSRWPFHPMLTFHPPAW